VAVISGLGVTTATGEVGCEEGCTTTSGVAGFRDGLGIMTATGVLALTDGRPFIFAVKHLLPKNLEHQKSDFRWRN
jgi:hypothetical protein